MVIDRNVYLRNYILGVLVFHTGKTLSAENIPALALSITESVIAGDSIWQHERMVEEVTGFCFERDVPQ